MKALQSWRSGSKRHALESVPGTLIPGVASGLGFIVIGRVAGADTLGFTSLAWVTANLGSSVLALGPAHSGLRATVTAGNQSLPEYRAIALRRSIIGTVVPLVVGATLSIAGWTAGGAVVVGGIWLPAQCMVLFESEVLRGGGQFARASWLLSIRAVAGWTASVAAAILFGTVGPIVLSQAGVSALVAAWIVARTGVRTPTPEVRTAGRRLGRPVSRLAAASYALGYADRYVVEGLKGPAAVGVYTLGYTLGQGVLEVVMSPLTNALIPRLVAETNDVSAPHAARHTVRRGATLLLGVSVASLPLIWLADVTGWLDHVSRDPSMGAVTALIALATGIQGITRLAYGLLLGQGRPEAAARAYWAVVLVSAVVVPALTATGGVVGAAWATLVQYVVLASLMMWSATRAWRA